MTDNDIIKDLECCIYGTRCNECCHQSKCRNMEVGNYVLLRDVLTLINRQKAEIENKSRTIIELCDARTEWKVSAIEEFAERLKEENIFGHQGLISAIDVDALVSKMVGEME